MTEYYTGRMLSASRSRQKGDGDAYNTGWLTELTTTNSVVVVVVVVATQLSSLMYVCIGWLFLVYSTTAPVFAHVLSSHPLFTNHQT